MYGVTDPVSVSPLLLTNCFGNRDFLGESILHPASDVTTLVT